MRQMFRAQLITQMGFDQVLEAENGQIAIEIVRTEKPRLVLLDLDLPQMGGLEVIPRLKAIDSEILILVLSGQSVSVYGHRVLKLGANGFVSKTEKVEDILSAIKMVLAGYQVFPAKTEPLEHFVFDIKGGAELLDKLTDKEMLVLELLVKGCSNQEIARDLHISHKTVSSHKVNLMEKLGVANIAELLNFAHWLQLKS